MVPRQDFDKKYILEDEDLITQMADNLFSTFGEYDFIGKSIPGMVFLFFLLSILPARALLFFNTLGIVNVKIKTTSESLNNSVGTDIIQGFHAIRFDNNPEIVGWVLPNDLGLGSIPATTVIVIVFFVLIAGFILGQGVHTLADFIENHTVPTPNLIENHIDQIPNCILSPMAIIKDFFIPHRSSYERLLDEDRSWKYRNGVSNQTIKKYKQLFEETYGFSPEKDAEDSYRLTMSYIQTHTGGRTGKYQASHAFCRSISLILTIITGVYLLTMIPFSDLLWFLPRIQIYSSSMLIELLFPDNFHVLIFIISIFNFLFIYAAHVYRIYFVNYIFSDFIVAIDSQEKHRNKKPDESFGYE